MELALVALVAVAEVAKGWEDEKIRGQTGEVGTAVVAVVLDDLLARLGRMALLHLRPLAHALCLREGAGNAVASRPPRTFAQLSGRAALVNCGVWTQVSGRAVWDNCGV